jgi:antitoxin component of RelBE/YafQ-DinJ toxin-antitoxin module
MAVIYLRIDDQEKQSLKLEAKRLGMQLTTYCRMILLKSLKGTK